METSALRSFTTVAASGGFRRAAALLGIPQPTVTAHVRKLEAEVGWPLMDRSCRPVRLTAAGHVFLPHAERLLALYEDALHEVRDLRRAELGSLAVGLMHYLSHGDGPRALARFRARWPQVTLTVRVGTTKDLIEMLESGQIDVAFVHRSVDSDAAARLSLTTLRRDRLVVLVPRTDPHCLNGSATLAGLASVPMVRFRPGAAIQAVVDGAAADLGLEFASEVECADMASAVAYVRLGSAAAIVPESFAEQLGDDLGNFHPQDASLEIELCAAWRSDRYLSAAARNFISAFTRDQPGFGRPGSD